MSKMMGECTKKKSSTTNNNSNNNRNISNQVTHTHRTSSTLQCNTQTKQTVKTTHTQTAHT